MHLKETFKVSGVKSNDRRFRARRKDAQVRGEQCSYAKLTEKLVRRIRSMYVPKHFGAVQIHRVLAAEGVKVSPVTIKNVVYGLSWGHVQ